MLSIKRSCFVLVLFGLLACASGRPAWAQEDLKGDVGLGLSYQSREPTGSRYDTWLLPYLDLEWGKVSLDSDDGLTWKVFDTRGWSAGPYLNYLPGRNADGRLRGLRNVADMAELGAFVQYAPDDFWRLFAFLGQAVGGAHAQGGALATLGGEIGYPLGSGIMGGNSLSAHYVDGRQSRTFFGVSREESLASGIDPYYASGGWQSLRLSQNVQLPLGDNWSLMTSISWTRLLGSAADSSIVRESGQVNQGQAQVAISHGF